MFQTSKIVIYGGGLIGRSIAWRLVRAGFEVALVSKGPIERTAGWAAAGMLSAAFEAAIAPEFDAQDFQIAAWSRDLWPSFAADLQRDSGIDVRVQQGPTLALLPERFINALPALISDEVVLDTETRSLEVPSDHKWVRFEADGQVDNRSVMRALVSLTAQLETDQPLECENTIEIDCRGWQAAGMRPVRGQMVSLAPEESHPRYPIRWGARYIVPKSDRTIIGATVEPDIVDTEPNASDIECLMAEALQLWPGLEVGTELERWTGHRPMAPDQKPKIGWIEKGRRYLASGHYRNGVLLAPATVEVVLADMLGRSEKLPINPDCLRPIEHHPSPSAKVWST